MARKDGILVSALRKLILNSPDCLKFGSRAQKRLFMKNTVKVFGIIAIAAIIGFSMLSCNFFKDDDDDSFSLNAEWAASNFAIRINGSTGVFTQINSGSGWDRVRDNGDISIGDQFLRNIQPSNEELRWTGQARIYGSSSYRVTGWTDVSIVMDSNGQTMRVHSYASNVVTDFITFTRR